MTNKETMELAEVDEMLLQIYRKCQDEELSKAVSSARTRLSQIVQKSNMERF
jgi:hypothetical protein